MKNDIEGTNKQIKIVGSIDLRKCEVNKYENENENKDVNIVDNTIDDNCASISI